MRTQCPSGGVERWAVYPRAGRGARPAACMAIGSTAARSPTTRGDPWASGTSLQRLGTGRLLPLYHHRWRGEQTLDAVLHGHALHPLGSTPLHPHRVAGGCRLLARTLASGRPIHAAAGRPASLRDPLACRATPVEGLGTFEQPRRTVSLVPLQPLATPLLPLPSAHRVVRLVASAATVASTLGRADRFRDCYGCVGMLLQLVVEPVDIEQSEWALESACHPRQTSRPTAAAPAIPSHPSVEQASPNRVLERAGPGATAPAASRARLHPTASRPDPAPSRPKPDPRIPWSGSLRHATRRLDLLCPPHAVLHTFTVAVVIEVETRCSASCELPAPLRHFWRSGTIGLTTRGAQSRRPLGTIQLG
jgi:hypothetical protein